MATEGAANEAMRTALFYDPRLVLERLGIAVARTKRLKRLRGTVAGDLQQGHLNCLELFELVKRQSPSAIYDVGANVGTSTLLIKALFPDAAVHAFEPLSKHCRAFRTNVGNLAGVTLHEVALGSVNSRLEMQIANLSDASSLLSVQEATATENELPSGECEQVRISPLDEYVGQNSLPLPDLLKMDVQGYELEVLRGASKCLDSARALIIEVSFVSLYKHQCMFHEIVAFCAARGFFVKAFAHGTALGQYVPQADVLFVKEIGKGRENPP
jgi:FkbM family methyltransferase